MTDWLRDRYSDMERPASDAAYLRNLHPAISAIQSQIEADAGREREPITDRASARFLAMLVRVSGARQALEIGTNLGYSASWIAGAIPPDGLLTCVDISAELLDRADHFVLSAGRAFRSCDRAGRGGLLLLEPDLRTARISCRRTPDPYRR